MENVRAKPAKLQFFLSLNMQISDILVCRHRPGCLSFLTGSLRSYVGCCNESDTLKCNFSLGQVFLRLFHFCHVILKVREWKIYRCGLALSSEPQIWKFHFFLRQTTSKIAPKSVPHVQLAQLFFLIQPIKSLICGVVVVVAVVIS